VAPPPSAFPLGSPWLMLGAAVRAGARGTDNLMPLILGAVKAEATLGEVSDALRDVFGEYRETVVL
jgi:methylmalonyl-CoA mutase N-terminal domain/subunit